MGVVRRRSASAPVATRPAANFVSVERLALDPNETAAVRVENTCPRRTCAAAVVQGS